MASPSPEIDSACAPACQVCGGLNRQEQDSCSFKTEALVASADNGCPACDILRKGLSHARPGFVSELDDVYAEKTDEGPLRLSYFIENQPATEVVEIYCHVGAPTAYSWIGPSTEVSIDSSSEECFDQVKGWIQDCLANHAECPADNPPLLPTRVVDVGSVTQPPRLHVTQDERERYIALSHCWGPPHKAATTIKTTTQTLGQFQTEIPWSQLTKTFRDAIIISRRLGIRYLWIDSLCILQGDPQDWAVEASRMTTVYSEAFLVIAASGATDGGDGCFLSSRSASIQGVLHIRCSGQGGGTSFAYARRGRYGISLGRAVMRAGERPHGWKTGLGQPLESRAWTYQEEQLAARALHYTEDELQWRCSRFNACECSGMRKAPGSGRLGLGLSGFAQEAAAATSSPRPGPQRKYYEDSNTWFFIVSEYTRRELTYVSDRLPGLSGIAGCWERAERDSFCAGLWLRDLPRHLMWSAAAIGPGSPARASLGHPTYYAPTWSWASITGAVEHYRDPLDLQVRILECKTKPSTANRFWPVRYGHITLIGLLIPIKVYLVAPGVNSTGTETARATDARAGQNGQYLGDILPDVQTKAGDLEIDEQEPHYLLPIGCNHTYTRIPVVSLVLRLLRSLPNVYDRVGLLITKYDGTWETFSSGTQETEITIL